MAAETLRNTLVIEIRGKPRLAGDVASAAFSSEVIGGRLVGMATCAIVQFGVVDPYHEEALNGVTGLARQAVRALMRILVTARAFGRGLLACAGCVTILAAGFGVGAVTRKRMARRRLVREESEPRLALNSGFWLRDGNQLSEHIIE